MHVFVLKVVSDWLYSEMSPIRPFKQKHNAFDFNTEEKFCNLN